MCSLHFLNGFNVRVLFCKFRHFKASFIADIHTFSSTSSSTLLVLKICVFFSYKIIVVSTRACIYLALLLIYVHIFYSSFNLRTLETYSIHVELKGFDANIGQCNYFKLNFCIEKKELKLLFFFICINLQERYLLACVCVLDLSVVSVINSNYD